MNNQNFRKIFVLSAKKWPVDFNLIEFKKSWLRFFLLGGQEEQTENFVRF